MVTKMPWFRLYSEILDDKKIKRICRATGHTKAMVIGVWVCLLSLANESSERGSLLISENIPYDLDDLSSETELPEDQLDALLKAFERYDMLRYDSKDGWAILNWNDRQFKSDNSIDRVQKYREKREELGLTKSYGYNRNKIYARDNNMCVYCGSTNNLAVDHAYPVALGGTDESNNLVCACKECNSGKVGRTPEMAGYTFLNKDAEKRYQNYKLTRNGYSNGADSDIDIDKDSESTQKSDLFEECQIIYETKKGKPVTDGQSFALMIQNFEKEGVTVGDYSAAIDAMDADGKYKGSKPTSYESWAIGYAEKRKNPPARKSTPTKTNEQILEEMYENGEL